MAAWAYGGRVLRLYDAATGQPEPVAGTRRGELRMLICGPGTGPHPHLGDLRSYLMPDLIRRWAERRGVQVFTFEAAGTADEGSREALRADHAALNIHPPDRTSDPAEPASPPPRPGAAGAPADGGAAFDIATGDGDRSRATAGLAEHQAAGTGQVTFEGRDITDLADDAGGCDSGADGIVWLSDVTGLGLDPLALRLAFLKYRYREQADLTWDALQAADRALRRWRERVAAWATEPSASLVRSYADEVTGAVEDDLDTPAALRHLQALEADNAVSPGAKFETFAYLDLLLGLDLAREIGRY
jgi:hypothetical protein